MRACGIIFFSLFWIVFLQGCASSGVSRSAASEADKAYLDANEAMTHTDGSARDAYQNTSQKAKGAMMGGAAGAIAGSMSSGIGIFPGLAGGAIFGGALGAYIDSQATLADQLENRGIKVIILGDQIMLVLPSTIIFNPNTPNIRVHAYSTLDLVSQFISQYPNMSVTVSSYTSATGPDVVNLALSQQQADNIVKYIWRTGINTRFLSAGGYGGTHLVSPNTGDWSSDNFRTEITLEKLPL